MRSRRLRVSRIARSRLREKGSLNGVIYSRLSRTKSRKIVYFSVHFGLKATLRLFVFPFLSTCFHTYPSKFTIHRFVRTPSIRSRREIPSNPDETLPLWRMDDKIVPFTFHNSLSIIVTDIHALYK